MTLTLTYHSACCGDCDVFKGLLPDNWFAVCCQLDCSLLPVHGNTVRVLDSCIRALHAKAGNLVVICIWIQSQERNGGVIMYLQVYTHCYATAACNASSNSQPCSFTSWCMLQAYKRRTFETECTPFDKPLAKFGVVSNLPQVWWSVFPFKRGKRQHQ